MKIISVLALCALLAATETLARGGGGHSSSGSGSHFVQGYTKSDGTYVSPHMSANPSGEKGGAYSSPGDLDPSPRNSSIAGSPAPQGDLPIRLSPPPSTAPARGSASAADETSISYRRGRSDRKDWERWVATLTTDSRLGALYWADQRSKSQPGNCIGTVSFQEACSAAQQRLAGPDTMRKTAPQYRLGWNSS